MCIIRTFCSYVKFRSFTTIEREGALGPLIQPFFGTPMANVCNICLCFTEHVRGRRKIGGSPKTEARGSRALWSQWKHSLGPEGLGCCLPLLSSAFNVTERNCESDRVDRQLLTASGEKSCMSVVSLRCARLPRRKMQNSVKKRNEENWFSTKRNCIYDHLKFIEMNL